MINYSKIQTKSRFGKGEVIIFIEKKQQKYEHKNRFI